jgi:hypothetical protein
MHIPNAVIRDESGYFKVNYGALRWVNLKLEMQIR